ncbi:MAG: signal peptide peptidase SppA [Alphaproteobacteria bacterium]|nr:MAG: signal peptide peptidase SppA [Alphaproteobacteria bacterium]
MSLDADLIVDRRRMRRKLTFWRVVAVIVAIAAVVALATTARRSEVLTAGGDYIARVKITGLIRNDQERVEALDKLAKSSAKAVIVHIDSPGGTTAGSEQLHDSLRRVAAAKPIVVVVDGLAASGGYIAAMSADHIVAQGTSLVGSIGVLFQYPNVSDLLKTIGVKIEEIKSSPLKAAPNGYEPTSPEARAAIEALVKDSYDWFRNMVRDRRKMDDATLQRVTDGRVFTGRQGLELKLVDEIGNEQTAVDWLSKEKGLKPDTPVKDWQLKSRFGDLTMLHLATAVALEAMGLRSLAQRLEEWGSIRAVERLNLDGMLALWHPPLSN